jgi:hypothetical protein
MLFIALLSAKEGTIKERISRRLQWRYPEELDVVAEYWLQTPDPEVILVGEADSIVPMMMALVAWDDLYDITVVPGSTAEQGLDIVKQMMSG